jgi:hypothetical protein
MNTKFFTLIFVLFAFVSYSQGQTQQDSANTMQQNQVAEQQKQITEVQLLEVPIYKLFPTENYWTFIKLDTRNGKMWQVHFTISSDGYQGELTLNSRSLVWSEEDEINGRFILYPTKNVYNFILLDQIDGRCYQVQWNSDSSKRFVERIY